MNIFEVIATRDRDKIIAFIDPLIRKAAREASARAHRRGIEVADGRAGNRYPPDNEQ